MSNRPLLIFAALAWLVAASALPADVLPGAGAPALAGGGGGHAWVCLPLRTAGHGSAILHLPPRGAGVPDGAVRLAVQLPDSPEGLGAWQNRLYIAGRAEQTGTGWQRRILTLTVEPGALAGSWAVAADGRLPALPPLQGNDRMLGFVGTAVGPAALLSPGPGLPPRLFMLSGPDWGRVSLPEEARSIEHLALVGSSEGFAVIDTGSGRAWVGSVRQDRSGLHVDWRSRVFARTTAGGAEAPTPTCGIGLLPQGYFYCWCPPGGGVEVWNATDATCYRLATLTTVPSDFAVAPLAASGRIALVWSEAAGATPSGPSGRLTIGPGQTAAETRHTHVVELSAFTGETLFDGQARVDGPVSSQELKLLAAVLVVVMAVVVLFVLRPGGEGIVISLPKDVVLAEPARRVAGGLIDLVVAALIAGRITEFSLADFFSPARLMTDSAPMTGLIAIAGVGFILGTLGEWLWGRSLGKAAVGCAVAWPGSIQYEGRIEPTIRRPTLWRAAVRNLIKWVLPPLALSGVFSPERRHRGDVLAGTAVVEHADEEDESDDTPDAAPPE